ncbi:MAG: hypothetical protein OXG68_13510 [Chloroflexi bacterium]|nr:hypothetical protein [Chloroflexota bacterium]
MTGEVIQLSPRGKAIYQLLSLMAALLPLYGAGFLASALQQLPTQPLVDLFEPGLIERVAGRALQLVILSGLVSAGIMMAGDGISVRSVIWLGRLWTALVIVSVGASPLEVGAALDLAAAIALLLLLAASYHEAGSSFYMRLWQVGLLLIVVSLGAAQLFDDRALAATRAFRLQVAYPSAGLSVMFWLMRRFSRVEADWAADGLRIVALLVFLAGGLISLGHLGLPALVSLGATPLIPLCFIVLAGHSYRALSSRNENASLAPHYIAAATLFWLVGGGFAGALSIQPAINEAMRGTDLSQAQDWLAGWVSLAIALAFVNECASSLRGDNRRVTGYVPLWLITFGVALASIVLACRGVVQIYLRDVAAVDASAMLELLLPLTVVWILCLLALAAGIVTYALGFWLRRPRIVLVDA